MAASAERYRFLYVRDEVIDRLWNTIVTAGWDEPKLRAERFQRIGSSNVPALWGLRAAVQLANQIGMERIEHRHRQMADHILKEMLKRGAESWTSPDPALRCAIAAVNVAPIRSRKSRTGCGKTKRSASARGPVEDPAVNAILPAAEGCGSLPRSFR